jgi:uncharacterized protein YndB with AHSA1/START domain
VQDIVEVSILLPALPQRVWAALTDYQEFGEWFRARLDGPFVTGELVTGRVTYPGYEHLAFEAWVVALEAPRRFAFRWHPYAVDPSRDYSGEKTTLVELLLEPHDEGEGQGTRLTVRESGFTLLPAGRQASAVRMNDEGWRIQMQNLDTYLAAELP